MANTSTANFVDRLLMKLDEAIVPIWIRFFFIIDQPIDEKILLLTFQQLIRETPRLRSLWNNTNQSWDEQPYELTQLRIGVNYDSQVVGAATRIHSLLTNTQKGDEDLPIKVNFGAVDLGAFLLSFELHHGASDGRSFLNIVKRFWEIFENVIKDRPLLPSKLNHTTLNDGLVIKQLLRNPGQILKLGKSANRQLARRADPLKHQATRIGLPNLMSFKIHKQHLIKHKPAALFYAAVVAAIIQLEDIDANKTIRLRLPVDIRAECKLSSESIGNACSALMIELDLKEMRSLFADNPYALVSEMESKLKQQLKNKLHIANAFECLLVSKLSTKASLHKAAPKELLGTKRSCSLVITFMGEVDPFITPPKPFELKTAWSHTPVWGINAYLYKDNLHINLCCFDGIWSRATQTQFCQYLANFLTELPTTIGLENV